VNASPLAPKVNGFGEPPPVKGGRKTVPFDYSFRYDLDGRPETAHTQSVTVSIEAAFTAVSIGYGVVPKTSPIRFGLAPKSASPGIFFSTGGAGPFLTASFGAIVAALGEALDEPPQGSAPALPIGARTAAVLREGIRLNPAFVEAILSGFGGAQFDTRILEQAFQVVTAPPGQVQFLYSLFDEGTGREFQSEPILNTAGLGTADGMRPFRYFARPIGFAPRSVIRMQIIEKSEFKGELHVSLQGYKTLGTPGSPTELRRPQRMRR